MTYAGWVTVCILALMAIAATLAGFVGWVLGKRRLAEAESRAWSEGFVTGAGSDDKGRRIQDRAARFGR